MKYCVLYLTVFCMMAVIVAVRADQINIAVATNFKDAMLAMVRVFEAQTSHTVKLSSASTGKLYAQIVNGAPYDVFFAADSERPLLLEQQGKAVSGSRFTYALGILVLWSADPRLSLVNENTIRQANSRRISIANPTLAPYGKAAQQFLERAGLWSTLRENTVMGENIGQAYQFVFSGSAELGFIAYSQLNEPERKRQDSYWIVDKSMYSPITQQAILLKDSRVARSFLVFVKSDIAQEIIQSYGYNIQSTN